MGHFPDLGSGNRGLQYGSRGDPIPAEGFFNRAEGAKNYEKDLANSAVSASPRVPSSQNSDGASDGKRYGRGHDLGSVTSRSYRSKGNHHQRLHRDRANDPDQQRGKLSFRSSGGRSVQADGGGQWVL